MEKLIRNSLKQNGGYDGMARDLLDNWSFNKIFLEDKSGATWSVTLEEAQQYRLDDAYIERIEKFYNNGEEEYSINFDYLTIKIYVKKGIPNHKLGEFYKMFDSGNYYTSEICEHFGITPHYFNKYIRERSKYEKLLQSECLHN